MLIIIYSDLKSVPHEILKLQNGKLVFIGKIVDVNRVRSLPQAQPSNFDSNNVQEVRAGFTWGEIKIAPLQDDELEDTSGSQDFGCNPDDLMVIPFQNENLAAYHEHPDGSRSVRSTLRNKHRY